MPAKLLPFPLLAACVLVAAGCGMPGAGGDTAAPPPAQTPAAPTAAVPVDDADVPAGDKKRKAKPQPPLLPDGSRSKFVPRAEGRKIVSAYLVIRSACRRVMVSYRRTDAAGSLEKARAIYERELQRIIRRVPDWDRNRDLVINAYKRNPRGAVVTKRGPHTLYDILDMTGDAFARDCQVERSASKIEKVKRTYGRAFLR
jgi:hypothetical protein